MVLYKFCLVFWWMNTRVSWHIYTKRVFHHIEIFQVSTEIKWTLDTYDITFLFARHHLAQLYPEMGIVKNLTVLGP